MRNRVFVDSNIWLYLFLQDDDEKYKIAEQYFVNNNLNTIFVTSYQVINEVSNVMLKKKFTEVEIREGIDYLLKVCALQEFAKEILLTASHVRERYSFSFWDSIIIGSALCSKCDTLITEDMQSGLIVEEKLLIRDILKNK